MNAVNSSQPQRAETINEVLYVALIKFAEFAKEANVDADGVFEKVVYHAVTNFELTQAEIADKFGLGKRIINKWMNGKATPHTMVRRHVADWIAEQARSKAAGLHGVREALKAVMTQTGSHS
jgi:ribosome-binding protein aMBF1 (putative translation factor)